MTRRLSSRSLRASSSSPWKPARTKPPSRFRCGRSSASARPSVSARCAGRRRNRLGDGRDFRRKIVGRRRGAPELPRRRQAPRGWRRDRAGRRAPASGATGHGRDRGRRRARRGAPAGGRNRRAARRPHRGGGRSRRDRWTDRRGGGRAAARPAPVTVRSIAPIRLPRRSPERVAVSSRLARVAASISMASPAASRTGGLSAGRAPICVFST